VTLLKYRSNQIDFGYKIKVGPTMQNTKTIITSAGNPPVDTAGDDPWLSDILFCFILFIRSVFGIDRTPNSVD
jgi:hypothetical protein